MADHTELGVRFLKIKVTPVATFVHGDCTKDLLKVCGACAGPGHPRCRRSSERCCTGAD